MRVTLRVCARREGFLSGNAPMPPPVRSTPTPRTSPDVLLLHAQRPCSAPRHAPPWRSPAPPRSPAAARRPRNVAREAVRPSPRPTSGPTWDGPRRGMRRGPSTGHLPSARRTPLPLVGPRSGHRAIRTARAVTLSDRGREWRRTAEDHPGTAPSGSRPRGSSRRTADPPCGIGRTAKRVRPVTPVFGQPPVPARSPSYSRRAPTAVAPFIPLTPTPTATGSSTGAEVPSAGGGGTGCCPRTRRR